MWVMLMGTLKFIMRFDWDWTHFWAQFDKILLVFMVLFYSLLGWHAAFHSGNPNSYIQKFAESMLDNQKLVIGALLGLITGRAIQAKIDAGQNQSGVDNVSAKV